MITSINNARDDISQTATEVWNLPFSSHTLLGMWLLIHEFAINCLQTLFRGRNFNISQDPFLRPCLYHMYYSPVVRPPSLCQFPGIIWRMLGKYGLQFDSWYRYILNINRMDQLFVTVCWFSPWGHKFDSVKWVKVFAWPANYINCVV